MTVVPETLPDIDFGVDGAEVLRHAAAPTIAFRLRVERIGGGPVSSVMLQSQIRIAAGGRPYAEAERERLGELFGRPEQWARSVRSMLWTNVTVIVPPFEHETTIEIPVALTYDFEVASAQWLSALDDGVAPLEFLFSGTVFYPDADGRARTALVPWDKEARFSMPVGLWKEAMEEHFPSSAWLRLDRKAFERLRAYRTDGAHPTWEHAIHSLLERGNG